MKIYNLSLTKEERDKAYELLDCEGVYDTINDLIHIWNERQNYRWLAYFNGRSRGYLVFCEGGIEDGRVWMCPGRGVDMDEDYSSWSMADLRNRVRLVCSFDQLAEDILEEIKYLVRHYEAGDEEYTVKKTRKVLKETAA